MAAGIIGADVEQLHQLGDQLRQKPAEIESLITDRDQRARQHRLAGTSS